jgi:predicted PolB exonuclease-like 3'-5' exonuclease
MSDIAFLVVDIETVADGRLIQQVRYPDEPELTPAQAVAKYREQLLAQSNGRSDFVPHTFQVPVSIAVAKVGRDLSLIEARTLDRPRFRPPALVRQFWRGWERHEKPTIVTFNGRFFDLPVLELAAYRYGIPCPAWFMEAGNSSPRSRWNQRAHLDLQEVLTNHGAVMMHGGLNLLSRLVGGAGKMETKGQMVQELWEQGQHERIDDYCLCDVLDTWRVLLRAKVMAGQLDPEREAAHHAAALTWIEGAVATYPGLADYLPRLRAAKPVGDDDPPFQP